MRMLSIGHPLPNATIDNHSIFNAPTIFDYEAIVVSPGGVFASIQAAVDASAEYATHADVPIVNGETSEAGTGIADVLRRRRDEFARALERGAVIAVFAYPPAMLTGVSGFTGCDRYFFLPAPSGMAWDSTLLRGGEGTAAAIVDHAHPFAPVVDAIRPDLLYRAYFDDRAPGFAAAAGIFARSPGGAPIGVQFSAGGGRVVFLPAPRSDGGSRASSLANALVSAMEEALAVDDAYRPGWLSRQELPGLADLDAAATATRDRRDAAEAELAEAEQAAAGLAVLRDVLWRGGDHGLRPAVLRCMTLLGFSEWSGADGPVLRSSQGTLHLEVAASRATVDMTPHYRLRGRLDSVIAKERRAPRGLIVVNGHRLTEPDRRQQQYENSLRVAAEATSYALLTATELFAAACYALERVDDDALEDADDSVLAAIRARIVKTDGVVELADLIGVEAEAEAEPEKIASEGGE